MFQMNVFYFYDLDSLQFSWERDWLKELFQSTSDIQFNFQQFRLDMNTTNQSSPPLLIINHSTFDYLQYFKDKPYFVIHLSDEYLTDRVDFYEESNCLHVFRCYLKPHYLNHPKITYLPLGYKQDMFDQPNLSPPPLRQRQYLWSFAGCPRKGERAAILTRLSQYQPNYLHLISYWNAPNSLSSQAMRELLYKSQIVPCLKGNVNIDTFRLFEALECGCIPIIYKYNDRFFGESIEYFQQLFGESHPIPTICGDNFQLVLEEFSIWSLDELEEKQQEIWQWYQNYKQKLKKQIRETILRLNGRNNLIS